MATIQKITPFLWYDHQAEQAAELYVSLFDDSKILSAVRYGDAGPGPKGSVMTTEFQLAGQRFIALNGGPSHQFTAAISLMVHAESQAEVDRLWAKLTANGGEESMCGWLKDPFGLSWQIVPARFSEMMRDTDAARRQRVVSAMLTMRKLELPRLEQAYRGQ